MPNPSLKLDADKACVNVGFCFAVEWSSRSEVWKETLLTLVLGTRLGAFWQTCILFCNDVVLGSKVFLRALVDWVCRGFAKIGLKTNAKQILMCNQFATVVEGRW